MRVNVQCHSNEASLVFALLPTALLLATTMASTYPQRKIGEDSVSAQGLGCMGMSFGYTSFGGYDDKASAEVLTKAADLGVTFWVRVVSGRTFYATEVVSPSRRAYLQFAIIV